jgi:predicted metal-dependent HD superfamily phosphohydrolase
MSHVRHDLIDPARRHYDDRLAYHNWQHAQDVMEDAYDLGNRVASRGIEVDMGVLAVAAAWHDAGYIEDHTIVGFETKEHYSAYLAETFLRSKKEDELFIQAVVRAILGTIHHGDRRDMNALVLHRADIANIGGPYRNFYRKSTLVHRELGSFGVQATWPEWVRTGGLLIENLIEESLDELPRLGEPITGEMAFPIRARANSRLLLQTSKPMVTNR